MGKVTLLSNRLLCHCPLAVFSGTEREEKNNKNTSYYFLQESLQKHGLEWDQAKNNSKAWNSKFLYSTLLQSIFYFLFIYFFYYNLFSIRLKITHCVPAIWVLSLPRNKTKFQKRKSTYFLFFLKTFLSLLLHTQTAPASSTAVTIWQISKHTAPVLKRNVYKRFMK